ncbi:MAG: tyrosine-type recombinase/integrase [Gammaproteobacteria bacterium]|nr:tyrosine-type recombinase/integrase [Gammaproteobacteria bacterium]
MDATSAQAWFKALEALSDRDRAICLLVTYTGMRVGEAMQLRWEDVDLKLGTLVLHQTKTDPVSLPLSRQAKSAIIDLPKDTDWIFPALRRDGEIGPITQVATAIANLKTVSGVQWSPHDARRGFISMSYKLGMPESISRRLTNHATRTDDAHDGYAQMTSSELAPFAQRIADHLESMLTGSTVVTQLQPVERTDNTDVNLSAAATA